MKLNCERFRAELQKSTNDIELSKIMCISRTQLWRAKKGQGVGELFIKGFKKAFPNAKFEDYFFYN